jgi:vacuolar-type H+-ATPase subunit H
MENEIDTLKRIKRLETEGNQNISYAMENASRLVREAELKAKQNEENALKDAEEDYEAAVSKAEEKARKERESVLKETSAKINKLKSIDKDELLAILEEVFLEGH